MKTSPYDFPPVSAIDLRRWAAQCDAAAHDPRASGDERDRLIRMRDALLYLADNDDWLNGKCAGDAEKPNGHSAAA